MHLKAFKKRKQNPFNSSNTVVMLEHVIKGFPFNKSNKSIKGILVNQIEFKYEKNIHIIFHGLLAITLYSYTF